MKLFNKFAEWSAKTSDVDSSRSNNFNVIRFVAAIMVIYGHMSAIMGLPVFNIYNQAVSTIGVKIFFIISGYLITKSFLKDSNFFRYMVRRCFRIFPGLIAVVLFAIFIVGPKMTQLSITDYFTNPYTWQYLKNIILYPIYSLPGVFAGYTYPNAINGSLWSLPVEFAMYLILPLLVVFFKKIKFLKQGIFVTAVLFLIIDYIHIAYFNSARIVVWGNNLPDWLSLIPFFFIGSFMSFKEFKRFFNLQLATALLVCGSLISLNYAKAEVLLAIVLPYFVLSFALCEKPLFANWFSKCDFSYGLYLYGFIVQQILFAILKPYNLSLNIMTCVCFAVTLLLAIISWYFVEKPGQKLGKKILNCMVKKM